MATKPPLLTNAQAATYLGLKPHTLDVWRSTKRVKIPFVRIGTNVRYRQEDLDRFLEKNTVKAS
jgi:excisionase family DNA binding protein